MKTKSVVVILTRTRAIAGLGLLAVMTALSMFHIHEIRNTLDNTALEVSQLQRTDRIARHFEPRYNAMVAHVKSQRHPRVFWTDRLHVALAEFSGDELSFSIADPVSIPVEFTGRSSDVQANEYLLQVSASLDGDRSLMQLLNNMSEIDAEFLHNRSCNVKRQENNNLLRLNCVYSIVDIVHKGTK